MKKITPRISGQAAEFIPATFSSMNAGAEFILAAFPALYKHTMAREIKGRFTSGELMLMVDVFNSTALTPGISGQHLLIQVDDGMALDHLDEEWEVDRASFLEKVRALSIFQAACLEIWANGFWCAEKSNTGNMKNYVEGLL